MGLSLSTPSDETLSSNRMTGFMSKVWVRSASGNTYDSGGDGLEPECPLV